LHFKYFLQCNVSMTSLRRMENFLYKGICFLFIRKYTKICICFHLIRPNRLASYDRNCLKSQKCWVAAVLNPWRTGEADISVHDFSSHNSTADRAKELFKPSKTGVPKFFPSMYPFSISIDEHVPLNMSGRRFFFREGPIVDFPGVGKIIFAGGNKCGKIWFSPLETKKTSFYQKIWWEYVTFQNSGRPWPPFWRPCP